MFTVHFALKHFVASARDVLIQQIVKNMNKTKYIYWLIVWQKSEYMSRLQLWYSFEAVL